MGSDLNTVLKSHKLNSDQISFLTYQILRGLKYLHSCNIIHRVCYYFYYFIFIILYNTYVLMYYDVYFFQDLKPSNLIVTEDLDVQVS